MLIIFVLKRIFTPSCYFVFTYIPLGFLYVYRSTYGCYIKQAYCLNVYVTPSSSLLFLFLFFPLFCSWNSRVTIEIHIQLVYDGYSRVLGDNSNRKIENENYLSYAIANAGQNRVLFHRFILILFTVFFT
jgi:hypothetical protein